MSKVCDSVDVEQPDENESDLVIEGLSASIGNEWDEVDVRVVVVNQVIEGDGEVLRGEMEVVMEPEVQPLHEENIEIPELEPEQVWELELTFVAGGEGTYNVCGDITDVF